MSNACFTLLISSASHSLIQLPLHIRTRVVHVHGNHICLIQILLQVEAINKEVRALRAMSACMADFKLDSKILTQNITELIVELEKQKASIRSFPPATPIVQPQLQVGINHTIATSSPKPQLRNRDSTDRLQFQGNNKRLKMSVLRL